MRMLIVMVAAMAFSPDAALAAPLPDLSWLSGDWRRCKDGEIVEERWLGPRGGLLIGANLTSSTGKASFENLRIAASDETWTYWASPMGRTPGAVSPGRGGRAARRVRQSRARLSGADRLLARRRRAARAHRRDDQGQAGGGRVALREGNGGRLSAIALT